MLLLAVTSCEKPIDYIVSNNAPDIVLYSFPMPDSSLWLHVSESVNVLSVNDFNRIHDGKFMVYRNDVFITSARIPNDSIWIELDNVALYPNEKYTIQYYSQDDELLVEGETLIPVPANISKLDTSSVSVYSDAIYQDYLAVSVSFSDDTSSTNYYQLIMHLLTERLENGKESREVLDYVKNDKVFNAKDKELSLFSGVDLDGLFDDSQLTDEEYGLQVLIPKTFTISDSLNKKAIVVELYTLSESYFSYARSRIISDYYENIPIFDPVKIYSNIESGEGVVAGLAVARDTLFFE